MGKVEETRSDVSPRVVRIQEATSAAIRGAVVDPKVDIESERSKASFSSQALAEALHGGKEGLASRQKLVDIAQSTPEFDKTGVVFMDRIQKYERGLKMDIKLFDVTMEQGLQREESVLLHRMVSDLSLDGLSLHWGMFVPTLAGQSGEDQMDPVMAAMQLQILGTYAQTELGHGTYLRGLEATATYDPDSEQFIVHSPTITSTKWWPGGLARTVTHAVVMLRLFVAGENKGPHAFLIQLRDLETHEPLPGITLGDIGPKMGFNAVDNGFLRFDHVSIPRSAMLMRQSRVEKDGTYVAPPVAKASYGTMVLVRSIIVRQASYALGKAVTIATRYCAVRRQTSHDGSQLETQVLDYTNTQDTLLPLIATTFAFHFTGVEMRSMYEAFEAERDSGSFSSLPGLHATSSALKAMCTWLTSAGIERCRLACGGHGYSQFSGLPSLYEDYVASATYEGENNVLCLQTARFLLKAFNGESPRGDMLQYLVEEGGAATIYSPADCVKSVAFQLSTFQHLARHLVRVAARRVADSKRAGKADGAARNANILDLIAAAKAHSLVVILSTFIAGVRRLEDEASRAVLLQLVAAFALRHILDNSAELLATRYMSSQQFRFVETGYRSLLKALRPNAVALVDSLMFSDYELNSCLGRYDGDVYNALYERANSKHNTMTATVQGPAYHSVIKPLLQRSRL